MVYIKYLIDFIQQNSSKVRLTFWAKGKVVSGLTHKPRPSFSSQHLNQTCSRKPRPLIVGRLLLVVYTQPMMILIYFATNTGVFMTFYFLGTLINNKSAANYF